MTPSPNAKHLYVTGGIHGNLYSTKTIRIEIDTMSMESLPNFNYGRTAHVAEFWQQNLYIFGGFNAGSVIQCEELVADAEEWSTIGTLRTGMEKPGSYVYKDEIFVAGYNSDHVSVYGCLTKQWRELGLRFDEI